MEAAVPLTGQVCGRIVAILPVRRIIEETIRDFHQAIADLHARYGDAKAH
jgi:enoyl-[acyl-carrier protein] reductase II